MGRKIHILTGLLALAIGTMGAIHYHKKSRHPFIKTLPSSAKNQTVADRVDQYGPAVRKRLAPDFERAGVAYPPKKLTLVGLKQESRMELWASDPPVFLKSYPILRASGVLGPKLKEGDLQVPEGLYRIESLNPNSHFHLALRVDYPNAHDKSMGKRDGRRDLGSDIMIHGGNCSIGCLAMGDEAAEDLFVLAAETGIEHISVILSPVDFRKRDLPEDMPTVPAWTPELYTSIRQELKKLDPVVK
jgi:hypothetical protein